MSESDWDLLGMVTSTVVGTVAIVFNRQFVEYAIEENRKLFPKWTYANRRASRVFVVFMGGVFLLIGLARLFVRMTGG